MNVCRVLPCKLCAGISIALRPPMPCTTWNIIPSSGSLHRQYSYCSIFAMNRTGAIFHTFVVCAFAVLIGVPFHGFLSREKPYPVFHVPQMPLRATQGDARDAPRKAAPVLHHRVGGDATTLEAAGAEVLSKSARHFTAGGIIEESAVGKRWERGFSQTG
jgi:hypothetical protein